MNPAGAVLVIIGILAVIVGVRGSQTSVFKLLTGKGAGGGSAPDSVSGSAPYVPGATQTAPAGPSRVV